jgi:DNA repair ATPase RecN
MGLFKKGAVPDYHTKTIKVFKEAVKEINELYDDAKAEYDTIETVVAEFSEFVQDLSGRLAEKDQQKMENFLTRLTKVNALARNNVRDLRDVLRNHKKLLKEIQNDL